MNQFVTFSKRSPLLPVFAGVGVLCFLLYCGICVISGANALVMPSFILCIPLYIIFPGLFWAKLIGPHRMGLTPLLSLLYGCGFFAALVCVSVRLDMLWLLRLLPPVLCAAYLFSFFYTRRLPFEFRPSQPKLTCLFIGFFGILCLLYGLFMGAQNPHPMASGSVFLSRDLLWNIGNGNAFMEAFPPEDIRFSGVRFSYHYLTEIITAGLCLVSGSSSYDAFTFFAGPGFLLGELLALYCLGRCFYSDSRKKSVALVVLLFGFQCASMWQVAVNKESVFANTLLKHLVTNINSQATALIFICIFTTLFTTMARLKFRVGWRFFAAYFASFFLLTFSKGPQAALILCSLAITMLIVLLFQKPCYARALLCLGGTAAIFLLIFGFLYSSGANSSMVFSIFSMENSLAYQTLSPLADWLCAHLRISGYVWLVLIGAVNAFTMIPLQFLLWLRGLPHTIRHLFHLDAGHILANGVIAGGFLAYHLFWHANSSQAYFALIAIIYANILAVEQLFRLKKPKTVFFYPAIACAAVGLCTTVFMVYTYGGQGVQQLQRTANPNYATPVNGQVSAGAEQAMLWLRDKTGSSTVFATNRTSSTPDTIDGISNVFSAFSGRQGYMEGWAYAVSNMGVSQDVVEHRQQVLDQIFGGQLSSQQLSELCKQEGINCIIYAKHYPGKAPNLTIAYENDSVCIYFL